MQKRRHSHRHNQSQQAYRLLSSLSDDLSLPLLQIKSSIDAWQSNGFNEKSLHEHIEKITLSADNGLQLIEAYRLVLQAEENLKQEFEPVAVGAVLQDVAHQLNSYAKKYNTVLRVDIQGHIAPVLAHQPSLFAAIEVLSSSMIRTQSAQSGGKKQVVVLGAHKGLENLVATGVFGNADGVSDKALRSARALVGKARQPFTTLPAGSASGILIADLLCSAMWQPLRAAAHSGMHGLATFVPVSKQLRLI